jgi:tol-pal system protein YbgF
VRRVPASAAACLALLTLAGCVTPPDEDPVQIKLNDVDVRLARIEKVVSNGSLLELSNQMGELRADLRAVHNDIDQLNHALDTNRKQQRDLYADVDQRLRVIEARSGIVTSGAAASSAGAGGGAAVLGAAAAAGATGGAAAPGAGAGGGQTTVAGTDTAAYQAAFGLLKDSQFDQAIAAFQQFLVTYPESSLADNAQYWLGEAYYVNKAFPDALAAFQRVITKYPQSRKVPDALLKVGYCYYELKQWQEAQDTLAQVVASYRDTPAGKLAQARLEKMATEKH